MTKRKVKDAKDLENDELIYFKGHAKATYMSDGRTVEDFTTLLKQKLDGLSNYDDTAIQASVSKLRTDLDTLVSGDTTTAIKTFNEVIAFLDGISDTEDLSGIISSIEQQIATKQDKITDLQAIREGASKGATALQSYTEKYKGTVTGVKINGSTKSPSSGIVDLGTVITEHQDISGKLDTSIASLTYATKSELNEKANSSSLSSVALSGSYKDLKDTPTIPSEITENTVEEWGFVKENVMNNKINSALGAIDVILDSIIGESLILNNIYFGQVSRAVYQYGFYSDYPVESDIIITVYPAIDEGGLEDPDGPSGPSVEYSIFTISKGSAYSNTVESVSAPTILEANLNINLDSIYYYHLNLT